MRRVVLLVAAVVLTGCSSPESPQAEPESRPDPGPEATLAPTDEFPTDEVIVAGDAEAATLAVHVAAEPEARRQGLMGREALPDEAGMLFVFPEDTDSGFWMKDTLIPLSIAFVDAAGTVVATEDMDPCDAEPCPTYEPGATYRYALEVNQGLFDELGVGPGASVTLPEDLPPAR